MRIAYVHTGQWPSNSPSMTFSTMTAKALAETTECCHFFIQRNSDFSSEEIFEKYFNLSQPENLFIYQYHKSNLLNSNHSYFIKVFNKITKLIKDDMLDAVISRNATFLPYLACIKKRYNINVFYETHNFYVDISIRNDLRKKKIKYSICEKLFIPKISGLICLQNQQRNIYHKYFPKIKIIVAPSSISNIIKTKIKERKYLGYIGSFDNHKGISILISAASQSNTKPDILIIGGKNEKEISKILNIASKYNYQSKVIITGWLKKKQLEEHLKTIKIGIVPLTDTFFNRYLTSPLKLFDFFSCGIPVISSDLPTMRELIDNGKTGILFEPENPFDLSQKIDIMLSNNNEYNNMVNSVYSKAEGCLWSHRASKIINEIKTLPEYNLLK
ncbi:MAG: glycosyltransferase [Spirochaetota bacterium]|nr:glycosyltransferase [Spirochaetota bacterium]